MPATEGSCFVNRRPYALLGESHAILDVLNEARFVSATDFRVMLTGESGVGKKQFAQFIHDNSPRRQRTMLSVNCARVPESRLETALFAGADDGVSGAGSHCAGLFEMAHGSTLLLDDVDAIGPHMQALLLRALENDNAPHRASGRRHEAVDARIISATDSDLLKRDADKPFRLDLYYRLNVAHLQIPPLRERREDIPFVMEACLESLSEQFRLPLCELHPSALSRLEAHSWPGNIRELHDVAEYLALTYAGRVVTADQLPEMVLAQGGSAPAGTPPFPSSTADPVAWACFERITKDGGSFWTDVYEPFMAERLSRASVRAVVSRGLKQTNGSYRALTTLFNLPLADHHRLLAFLHQYDCLPRPQAFRAALDDVRTAPPRTRKAAG